MSHSQRTPFFRLLDVLPLLLPAAHDCANCVVRVCEIVLAELVI